ncbi:unnamed protein product [Brassica napus]|uniref:(rape) hypothetical protein n=1 Tax=Brassica napus TaxID=3708 RepID=A0A816NQW2_BRANA|nr:unnamed protein product [Brassica napus]
MGVGAGDTEGAADDDDMADIRELRDEDFISMLKRKILLVLIWNR